MSQVRMLQHAAIFPLHLALQLRLPLLVWLFTESRFWKPFGFVYHEGATREYLGTVELACFT